MTQLQPDDVVIDVGSGSGTYLEARNRVNRIIAVDMRDQAPALERYPNVTFIKADARNLPLPDKAGSIVFCNSLIEHVPKSDRQLVADEIRRVGRAYWVQTPNKWFPIEPHYMLPLFQFLPKAMRRILDARRGDHVELLTARELQELFPEAVILRERILGLTKSLIAHH